MVSELPGVVQARLGIPVSAAPGGLAVAERPGVALPDVHDLRGTVRLEFALGDGGLIVDAAARGTGFLLGIVGVVGTLQPEIEAFREEVEFELVLQVEVDDILPLDGIAVLVDQAQGVVADRADQVGIGNDPASFFVQAVTGHRRTIVQKALQAEEAGLAVILAIADGVPSADTSADSDGKRAALGEVHIEIRAEVVPAVFEVRLVALVERLEKAVLVERTDRNEIPGTLRTTRDIDIILLLPGVVVHQVREPVGAGIDGGHIHVLPVLDGFLGELPAFRTDPFHFLGVIVSRGILVRAGRLEEPGDLLETGRGGQGDGRLAGLAAAGRDEDDAVGAADTEDGRGGGVLEDGNVLHLVRVYLAERTFDTVDKHERFRTVERSDAADADDRVVTAGNTGILHRLEAGELTGQGVAQRSGRGFEELLAAHVGDGSRQRHFALLAIADDHQLLQHLGIQFQDDIQGSRCRHHFLLLVTDIGKHQGRTRRNARQHIVSVRIGRSAIRPVFDLHDGTDQRHVLLVSNSASHGQKILCEGHSR